MTVELSKDAERHLTQPLPLWLRAGFWVCVVIAVAVVIRRVFALADPPQSGPPQLVALDQVFASHGALTLAHILPALAFVLITPFLGFSPFCRDGLAGSPAVFSWRNRRNYGVCDERLFRWRMAGALSGPGV